MDTKNIHRKFLYEGLFLGALVFLLGGFSITYIALPVLSESSKGAQEESIHALAEHVTYTNLLPVDFSWPRESAQSVTRLQDVAETLHALKLTDITFWNSLGVIVYSDEPLFVGEKFSLLGTPQQTLTLNAQVGSSLEEKREGGFSYKNADVRVALFPDQKNAPHGVVTAQFGAPLFATESQTPEDLFAMYLTIFLIFFLAVFSYILWRAYGAFRSQKDTFNEYLGSLEEISQERARRISKASENELSHAKELMRLKDQFLVVATHELRSTANAIKWGLEALLSERESIPEKEKELFNIVIDGNRRLLILVNDLLEVARIEGGTVKLTLKKVSVYKIVEEVVSDLKPLAGMYKVSLRNTIPHDFPEVIADPQKIKEIFNNLISNGIKYNKKGSSGEVKISGGTEEGRVIIHVEDNGLGISEENKSHIFKKFWRAEEVLGTEGTGLGLFIAKRLIELMSGAIWFTSQEDKGTTFSVSLKRSK